jgi:hypothetical protein
VQKLPQRTLNRVWYIRMQGPLGPRTGVSIWVIFRYTELK